MSSVSEYAPNIGANNLDVTIENNEGGSNMAEVNSLDKAALGREYTITSIKTDDEELKGFLFSLGCYEGQEITLISKNGSNYIINVKDARYSIDDNLAKAIEI